MSVPLFLDSEKIDYNSIRFVYWKLNLKQVDLDELCDCNKSSDSLEGGSFSDIKLHFFWNQLVIKGISGFDHSGFNFKDKDAFFKLFDIVYGYRPRPEYGNIFYALIDNHYVSIPVSNLPQRGKEIEEYKRGTIFRIEEDRFADVLYDKEETSYLSESFKLEHSPLETQAYLEFLQISSGQQGLTLA